MPPPLPVYTKKHAAYDIPHIQALGPPHSHFLKLGLLNPQGGGQIPLDAIVVIDTKGRRRLVLPFGWGVGRYAFVDVAAWEMVSAKMMQILKSAVAELVREG